MFATASVLKLTSPAEDRRDIRVIPRERRVRDTHDAAVGLEASTLGTRLQRARFRSTSIEYVQPRLGATWDNFFAAYEDDAVDKRPRDRVAAEQSAGRNQKRIARAPP